MADIYWLYFTLGAGLAFGIYEFINIKAGHRERTYTYWIRVILGIEGKKAYAVWTSGLFAAGLIGFIIWFIPHIIFGWWGGAG